ncbi:RING/FYVE/PHD zinc finger superfamily protein [Striga asiatica]|uniref:RING/FYVE/PHD zinc finger superfamily protein n=1 Tax=Striga asiatica TaxID=4170 RepID=A0A5A7QVV7_STRAF|nr:RING/FYVE/PHD zinc finger superfamily protein [Striga asiatica]
MGEHTVENVNQLPKLEVVDSTGKKPEMVGSSSSMVTDNDRVVVVVENEEDEQAPLIGMGECRICQEEDSFSNLESPCACSGSLKYAHRKCVQHWCNEKGDITCEICHQQYQPGYTAIPRPPPDETTIDIGGVWQISGTPLDMHDPRLLAIAEAERQLFEADYDDYNGTNASGAAFCRSAALILMALLLLRHALSITDDGNGDGDDDASAFLSLFLLRAVGFLLPCYIMIWAISILQRRRQRQEAAALAATQFAIVVQSAQSRGLLVAGEQAEVPLTAPSHPEHV